MTDLDDLPFEWEYRDGQLLLLSDAIEGHWATELRDLISHLCENHTAADPLDVRLDQVTYLPSMCLGVLAKSLATRIVVVTVLVDTTPHALMKITQLPHRVEES